MTSSRGSREWRALSPDPGARTAFAERLALLYKEAGNPPLKRVAEAVDRLHRVDERGRPVRVSAQRISDWRRAKNVPAQFAALSAVLQVLIPQARRAQPAPVSSGLYDMAQWQKLWERAVADPVADLPAPETAEETDQPPPVDSVCPYRGLASYRREDARWFFGRERSTDALVAQLRSAEAGGGLVMLVGASGAGKSSLLNAGLVTALQSGALADDESRPQPILQLVPGTDPVKELTRRIPELAGLRNLDDPDAVREAITSWARRGTESGTTAAGSADALPTAAAGSAGAHGSTVDVSRETGPSSGSGPARPVVIVDQFEETFTLGSDETARRTFVQLLHSASTPAAPGERAPALVVLGIRADFYEQCLGYPELADALQHRHMVLGPLSTAELREAVTGPAKAVGLELEPGLAELIVREVSADGPRGAHDAGILPLLSHALLATWQRRKAGRLT
ncbi:ATP-binding protein, partial [Streptomyces shenzhenensis]|uniref:ATP-binding protein n=1 Tax=Streptomyces shenzhenensis TaxID=943815 RepID=UPI0015F1052B